MKSTSGYFSRENDHVDEAVKLFQHFSVQVTVFFPLCSSDKLYAYLTQCRPDLCIIEGGEDEGEADRDEEEFVLIEDETEEEEMEEEVFRRHRSSGDEWEVSVFIFVSQESSEQDVDVTWTFVGKMGNNSIFNPQDSRNS